MNDVRRQMVIYERQGLILKWHDRQIPPGMEWEGEIDQRLNRAHIILLFVSPSFLESRYCWDVEVKIALARHDRGEAVVIPIILRPCAWEMAPFAKLQALPTDARPLTQWPDRDQVTLEVAKAIATTAEDIKKNPLPRRSRIETPAIERRRMPGDRIDRLFARFSPPTGRNIPKGYQRRLNQIATHVVRDSATRDPSGGYRFPAQFSGAEEAVSRFETVVVQHGTFGELGVSKDGPTSEIWFDYRGATSPEELAELAKQHGLEVVHCGVTLMLQMG